jgi:DNA-binding MarR family transcriptional regulator
MPTSQKLEMIASTISSECLAVRVRMLNRVITAVYDDILRPFGITVNQLNMLVVIIKIPKPTAKSIARILKMETSTVSRNLERMKRQGWLTVRGQNGRIQELGITKEGAKLMEKALPAWRKAQTRIKGILGRKELSKLFEIADSIATVR